MHPDNASSPGKRVRRKIVGRRSEVFHVTGHGVKVERELLLLSCGHEVRESMGNGFYHRVCPKCSRKVSNAG
jgi:hypothetical protein